MNLQAKLTMILAMLRGAMMSMVTCLLLVWSDDDDDVDDDDDDDHDDVHGNLPPLGLVRGHKVWSWREGGGRRHWP